MMATDHDLDERTVRALGIVDRLADAIGGVLDADISHPARGDREPLAVVEHYLAVAVVAGRLMGRAEAMLAGFGRMMDVVRGLPDVGPVLADARRYGAERAIVEVATRLAGAGAPNALIDRTLLAMRDVALREGALADDPGGAS
jgi:hypothetical protein